MVAMPIERTNPDLNKSLAEENYIRKSKGELCTEGCGNSFTFDPFMKSPQARSIPLNLDGTKHDCPNDTRQHSSCRQNQSSAIPKAVKNELNNTKLNVLIRDIAEVKTAVAAIFSGNKNTFRSRQLVASRVSQMS